MRPAKTTIIYFLSDVATSLIGFLATLYFARVLGAAVLGKYYVVVAILAWVSIPSNGIASAINKRVSEGTAPGRFLSAGFLMNGLLAAGVALVAIALRHRLDAYVGAPVGVLFAVLFVGHVGFWSVRAGLAGQRKVAQAGALKTADRVLRVGTQVGLVIVGYEVVGLVVGHALGFVVAAVAGLVLYEVRPSMPRRDEVRDLLAYARYAWLGDKKSVKSRTFAWMDTLVLSLFVGSGLIGVYEIAWRLASVLVIVSNSIQHTLFPEISGIAADGDYDEVRKFMNEALFYAGIFTIPGLFGAAVIGPKLLRIYGAEFVQGGLVLLILIVARTLDAYGTQLLNIINAIDRPDITFRINFAFIATNLVLNVGLVYWIGWHGAAIATAVSAGVTVVAGYVVLADLLDRPQLPIGGIVRQTVAAAAMGAAVWGIRGVLPWQNMYVTVGLVFFGAGVYVVVLHAVSTRVREKTRSLLPPEWRAASR